jgi:ribose-phosphate pyrophosphokinase
MKGRLLVFGGTASRELARKVCDYLNIPLANASINRFPDGEIDVKANEDVRGSDVFVIQSTCPPVNENIMELLIQIDCFRRASADRITAVIPYYGYARQDRKAEGRVPITAKLIANLISTSGADRVLAMDLHAAQIQGFFDIPMDHLFASPVLVDYIKRLDLSNLLIVSPDIGGVKMARAYAKRLDVEIAIVDKRRIGAEETEVMHLVGNVEGRNVVLLDDIISTGTSIANAARACKKHGARSVYLMATHAVFSKGCAEKLAACDAKEIIVTDTIPVTDEKRKALPNLKVLTIASLLGETISRIHKAESVSQLFL